MHQYFANTWEKLSFDDPRGSAHVLETHGMYSKQSANEKIQKIHRTDDIKAAANQSL